MRSNKLISMLAMAAVMVGCSQEELLTVDNQQLVSNDLAKRPVIGNVEIGLGVESRMALKDGSSLNLAYEEGDKVGAALIDTAKFSAVIAGKNLTALGGSNYGSLSWSYDDYINNETFDLSSSVKNVTWAQAGILPQEYYNTVEYISSNYPFTRNADGAFESEANLLEGNYMFYMPYNAKHLNRKPIEAVLPQIQDCSDDVMRETTWKSSEKIQASSTALSQFYAGTMAGFEGAPVLAGYKFLAAPQDGSLIKPVVEMNHLYAYPMITIKNDFNGYFYGKDATKATANTPATATMTVDSIQVYYEGAGANPLFYSAPINSAKIASILAKDGEWETNKLQSGANTKELLGDAVNYAEHANVDVTKADVNNVDAAMNRVTLVVGKELAAGASYSFHAVLPAGNYGKDLKALVYATIGGTRYVILNAVNTLVPNVAGDYSKGVKQVGATDATEYAFGSARYADVELVRGEHFPKAEINVDAEGNKSRKAFAGEGLTISLGTKYDDDAKTYTGGTAFELEKEEVKDDNGITSNEDLVNWLNSYVGRGEAIASTADKEEERDEWAPNTFAIAKTNTIVIDAQLIKDLKKQTVDDANVDVEVADQAVKLTLNANLPVANDVKITNLENTTDTIFTFETLDADKVSYKIKFTGVTFNANAEKLVAGINVVSASNKELKPKSSATNSVVVLGAGQSVKYTTNSTGISSIYVNGGTLNVNTTCAVLVTGNGTIEIGENGSLTNTNNILSGTIVNNKLNAIAGTLVTGTVVSAEATGWPNAVIPASAKINSYTINPAIAIEKLATEQADIAKFANLSNVTVTLETNVQGLTSAANVTLTNIAKLASKNTSSISWYTSNVSGISVNGHSSNNKTIFEYITYNLTTPLKGVSFANIAPAI